MKNLLSSTMNMPKTFLVKDYSGIVPKRPPNENGNYYRNMKMYLERLHGDTYTDIANRYGLSRTRTEQICKKENRIIQRNLQTVRRLLKNIDSIKSIYE